MLFSISEDPQFHTRIQEKLSKHGIHDIQSSFDLDAVLTRAINPASDLLLLDYRIAQREIHPDGSKPAVWLRFPIVVVSQEDFAGDQTGGAAEIQAVPIDFLPLFVSQIMRQSGLIRDAVQAEVFDRKNLPINIGSELISPGKGEPPQSDLYRTMLAELELNFEHSYDLNKALNHAIEILTKTLELSLGAVVLFLDPEEDRYRLVTSNIPGLVPDPQLAFAPEHFQALQIIAEQKEKLVISDIRQSPYEKSPVVLALAIGSGVGLPLVAQDELVGVLFAFDRNPRDYSSAEIQFLSSLANITALAVTKIKLFQSLQDAKETAERAARVRSDYLARMSHELRAPLAAINNLSELMASTVLSSIQVDYLNSIRNSAVHLLALFNDVLDYSRLEANHLELKRKESNLTSVIESSLNLIAIPAAQKNLDLGYRLDDDVPETLLIDPIRLSQILTNLLTNAVKFTYEGSITVEVKRRASNFSLAAMVDSQVELLFVVTDTGPGISPEKQQMIFEPFSQVDGARVAEQGSGLGLSICRSLVALMKGEIWVESEGIPGRGSSFFFTIQATAIHTPEAPYRQSSSKLLAHKRLVVYGEKRTSLVLLSEALEKWGGEYIHCSTIDEVKQAYNEFPRLDMILIDERSVPPGSETILLEYIDKWKNKQSLSVIIFSAPNTRLRKNFHELTTTILHWPFSISRLYRSLSDALLYSSAVTRPQPARTHIDILLVDDDPVNLSTVQLLLNRLGLSADTAPNGAEALEKIAAHPYHLVIMDMRMGVMDGYSTSRAIRENFPPNQQPVIAILSAGISPQQLNALQSSTIEAYLEKPISLERLMNLVDLARNQMPAQRLDYAQSSAKISNSANNQSQDMPPKKSGVNTITLSNLLRMAKTNAYGPPVDMILIFMQSAPTQMEKALQAASESDLAGVKSALHALRGTCEIFGAERLAELCKSVEHSPEGSPIPDLSTQIKEIQAEFQFVKTILLAHQQL